MNIVKYREFIHIGRVYESNVSCLITPGSKIFIEINKKRYKINAFAWLKIKGKYIQMFSRNL